MNSKLLICILPLLISACSILPSSDPNSPNSKVPVGSTLVLKHRIVIPANRFDVLLARAKNIPDSILRDEKDTSCVLEMRNKHGSDRTIEPTEFRVTREKETTHYTLQQPIHVANGAESRLSLIINHHYLR